MFVGDVNARTKDEAARFRQLTYTCMTDAGSREREVVSFPQKSCKSNLEHEVDLSSPLDAYSYFTIRKHTWNLHSI